MYNRGQHDTIKNKYLFQVGNISYRRSAITNIKIIEDIRRYCIDKALYTLGDNDEYTRLLMAIKGQRITLQDIAKDIYDHSRYLDGMTVKDMEKEIITTIIRGI